MLTGFNRNTVNRRYGIFRHEIYRCQSGQKDLLYGSIEVDESYLGARRQRGFHGKLKHGRGTLKQPVFGIFERDGRVYTEIVPDCKKQTLQAVILGKVAWKRDLFRWLRGYSGLVDVGYSKHLRVNHRQNEFADGIRHINGIESFCSFTKRRLAKFNGVTKNFDLHLKECEWRRNRNADELSRELWELLK